MRLVTGLGLLAAVELVGCSESGTDGGSGGTSTGGREGTAGNVDSDGGGTEGGGSSSGGASGGTDGGAGGDGAGGASGAANVGTGGSSGAEGPSCVPREVPTCRETWYVNSAGRCAGNPAYQDAAGCSGDGYASVTECLQACEPDSLCLISPVPSMYGPCDPEVHTEYCWLTVYCICICQEAGTDWLWSCAC
jgi:hypothetical protein